MRKSIRTFACSVTLLALGLGFASPANAQNGGPAPDVSSLAIPDGPVTVDPQLAQATGEIEIVVRLSDPPLAVANGANSKQAGAKLTPGQQRKYSADLTSKQNATLAQITALGGVEVGRVRIAYNAVIVKIDAAKIPAVSALPGVMSVRPVGTYELDLSETVPHIGAAAAQAMGVDGAGVTVAVLDSGIDYTHYNLGGLGTFEAYTAAYGTSLTDARNTTRDGLFPTAKVIEGYDFVGELWPTYSSLLSPDPDPIDAAADPIIAGGDGGHGTHVADIIAGSSMTGTHKGVAPGASLLAVKVCSSVSTSCSGVALLLGMDYALDPNGDGTMADAVDVINLSLGSSYGQKEDDLSFASANAVRAGVVVVASAGNAADRPYIVGSPSSTPEVISVAQTQVPSALLFRITAGSAVVGGSWQLWSAPPAYATGLLQYGDGAGGNLLGCVAFPAGSLTGRIVLVDRGTCAISLKVSNIADGGALAAIIANNATQAPGDLPPDFSYGGGTASIPGYTVTRADGLLLKSQLGQTATIDPAVAVSLVGNMVSSSSRGPSFSYNAIKPDIGAPGASLSAEVGTGNGQTAFGGTSGAAPMVSGAAALVIQKNPALTPAEVKSVLMNTAETNIGINPVGLPGVLAPITRIGGGEVRVDRAIKSTTAAWDASDLTGSLSWGYQPVTGIRTFNKSVRVQNYSSTSRTYTVVPSFRYADDAASGAVRIEAPASIVVPPGNSRAFNVKLTVDASKLPVWTLNGGSWGGDGYRLQGVEFDGYLTISDATDSVHLAWQILPHRAAEVKAVGASVVLNRGNGSTLVLQNKSSVLNGNLDVFSLTGTSPRITKPNLPQPGDNFAIVDLQSVGVRQAGSAIQFAVNTFGQRAHPNYPAEFDVYVDNNRDGNSDYVIYNTENGGFGASGQNVVIVYNLATGSGTAYYYTDADLNSANAILTAPLAALGLTPTTQFDFSIYACDNYFTGACTDAIENMTYTAGTPRYVASAATGAVPAGSRAALTVQAVAGGDVASPSQMGLLLLYRDAQSGLEADAVMVR